MNVWGSCLKTEMGKGIGTVTPMNKSLADNYRDGLSLCEFGRKELDS